MKNIDTIKILIISVAIVLAGFFIGNMHKTGKKYDRYVQVKGLSEREVNADLAVWPINIIVTGNDLNSLKNKIDNQNKIVKAFFEKQGFNNKEITLGSTNIEDSKAKLYNSNNNSFRYIAKSEFTIRTNNISKLKKALSKSLELTSDGILLSSKNTWRPIEYIYTKLNDIKPPMIEEATKNARKVAAKFAKDSNAGVGEIRTAKQGLFSINDRDVNTPEIKIVRVVSTIEFRLN